MEDPGLSIARTPCRANIVGLVANDVARHSEMESSITSSCDSCIALHFQHFQQLLRISKVREMTKFKSGKSVRAVSHAVKTLPNAKDIPFGSVLVSSNISTPSPQSEYHCFCSCVIMRAARIIYTCETFTWPKREVHDQNSAILRSHEHIARLVQIVLCGPLKDCGLHCQNEERYPWTVSMMLTVLQSMLVVATIESYGGGVQKKCVWAERSCRFTRRST